jgi:hypothetical protein
MVPGVINVRTLAAPMRVAGSIHVPLVVVTGHPGPAVGGWIVGGDEGRDEQDDSCEDLGSVEVHGDDGIVGCCKE